MNMIEELKKKDKISKDKKGRGMKVKLMITMKTMNQMNIKSKAKKKTKMTQMKQNPKVNQAKARLYNWSG